MAIDTPKVARRLRDAGFTEPQAEAVRGAADDADLATKNDLRLLGTELRAEIAALRSEMREMEQRVVAEMVSRMFGMVVGAVLVNIVAMLGVMFAFAKLLGH